MSGLASRASQWRLAAACLPVVTTLALMSGCGSGHVTPAAPTRTPTAGVHPTPSVSRTPSPTPTPAPTSAPTTPPPTTPAPSATATGLPTSLIGRVFLRIPTTAHVVALTFDGGSGAQGAPSVLATLRQTGTPATFFLTGRFTQIFPQTTTAIAQAGLVGNHSMTHPHLPQLPSATVTAEVTGAEGVIDAATKRTARPWFRFPYGEYDARTLGIVNGLGYAAIGWTIDSRGWMGHAGAGSADDVVSRVLSQLQPGAIVLMHLGAADDGSNLDAEALPKMIAGVRDAGYSFVTIDALR
jgi:peptidoglycan/xylan/chitin deacetylase (PgdA/CDA1 family)